MEQFKENRGLIHIYCGDGKGKTSAAVGLAVRAAGRGMKVLIIRFLKTDDSGEVDVLRTIPQISLRDCDQTFGFFSQMSDEDRARAGEYYGKLLKEAVSSALDYDMIILDEILAADSYGLIDEDVLIDFLQNKPFSLEVVLTGREASDKLMELADYVSEVRKIKHPYDKGIMARKGIEY